VSHGGDFLRVSAGMIPLEIIIILEPEPERQFRGGYGSRKQGRLLMCPDPALDPQHCLYLSISCGYIIFSPL